MPEGLFPWEFEPVENRRKKYVNQGGLGNDMNGHKNPREVAQHICVVCRTRYNHTPDLDFSDFGDVTSNLCKECKAKKRALSTNHPEMR